MVCKVSACRRARAAAGSEDSQAMLTVMCQINLNKLQVVSLPKDLELYLLVVDTISQLNKMEANVLPIWLESINVYDTTVTWIPSTSRQTLPKISDTVLIHIVVTTLSHLMRDQYISMSCRSHIWFAELLDDGFWEVRQDNHVTVSLIAKHCQKTSGTVFAMANTLYRRDNSTKNINASLDDLASSVFGS